MARKPKKPSFFKILFGDFSLGLRIPPTFIRKNFNRRPLCKCDLRGPTGIRRTVELEDRENGLFFRNGWQGFVKDNHLESGDLLVFDYDGETKFNVKIYDRSACEKDVEAAKMNTENQARAKDENVDLDTENYSKEREIRTTSRSGNYLISRKRHYYVEDTSTGSVLLKSENKCFLAFSYKKHLLQRVRIPKQLAVDEGLMSKNTVTLQDPAGRSWLIQLRIRRPNSTDHLDISTGWTDCVKAN
ncbi:B3 domain-containing protein LOC_Os12g40080-like [Pyrus x bretschneideri]|uniref:B3 domain-containing protein LOC_Os12g40080-like n=1 Tax=Pyrus x bretschneideri TaxID=225117 RepID=UPI00202E18C7|nr:B3 domain-containing protein LOC_Os12g40080-like [Pyrus x bretschneideri]